MPRLVDRVIKVTAMGRGVPVEFVWGRRVCRVHRLLDFWRENGRWWVGERPRYFFRVVVAGGGVFELYREDGGQNWYLYKAYD